MPKLVLAEAKPKSPAFSKVTKMAQAHLYVWPNLHQVVYLALIDLCDNWSKPVKGQTVADHVGKPKQRAKVASAIRDLEQWGFIQRPSTRGRHVHSGTSIQIVGNDGVWPPKFLNDDGTACFSYLEERPPCRSRERKVVDPTIGLVVPSTPLVVPGDPLVVPPDPVVVPALVVPQGEHHMYPRGNITCTPGGTAIRTRTLSRTSSTSATSREEELMKRVGDLEKENEALRAGLAGSSESFPGVPPGLMATLRTEWDRVHVGSDAPKAESIAGAIRAALARYGERGVSLTALVVAEALLEASNWEFTYGTKSPLGSAVCNPALFGGGGERLRATSNWGESKPVRVYPNQNTRHAEFSKRMKWH